MDGVIVRYNRPKWLIYSPIERVATEPFRLDLAAYDVG